MSAPSDDPTGGDEGGKGMPKEGSRRPQKLRIHPNRAPNHPSDTLKSVLDQIPFTPSQGVRTRTPSPARHSEANVRTQSQGNPFFSDDASSPQALRSDPCIPQEPVKLPTVAPQHDVRVGGLPHPSPLANHHNRELLVQYGHRISPSSLSQASTSSGSPHHLAQLDAYGVSMAGQQGTSIAGSPRTRSPSQNEHHANMCPPEDYRASAYQTLQMFMPHSIQGTPMDRPAMVPRPPPPTTHSQGPTAFDGRPPGGTHSGFPAGRGLQISPPPRGLGKRIHRDGSNRQANCARRNSIDGTTATNSDADQSRLSCHRAGSDALSSFSTESPSNPDSPKQHLKAKVEVKLTSDGQLVFNARQRRTLRRALQRQRKELPDGQEFKLGEELTEEERNLVVDVLQSHIGFSLPDSIDVDSLMKLILSLGVGE